MLKTQFIMKNSVNKLESKKNKKKKLERANFNLYESFYLSSKSIRNATKFKRSLGVYSRIDLLNGVESNSKH